MGRIRFGNRKGRRRIIMPFEEDKDPVEQINNDIAQRALEEEQKRQNTLRVHNENIENQRKKEAAQKIFDNISNLDGRINNIEAKLSQIPQIINQSIQNAFSQIQQPQPMQAPTTINDINDPTMKAQILSQLGPIAIELIKVIKGGNAPVEDYFGNMSKEITMNMLRAGVDGIMQNVYHNYNPIPPKTTWNQTPDTQHKLQ